MYGLYLYFLGLSFRNVSRAIKPFVQSSHVAVLEWIQKFNPKQIYPCKRVSAFLIDETMVQIRNTKAWLWIAVEAVHRVVLGAVRFTMTGTHKVNSRVSHQVISQLELKV
jgi:transposase-like protein